MAEEAKARSVAMEEPVIESLPMVSESDDGVAPEAAREEADATRLRAALDTIDEKIKLLLARHTLLAERYVASVAAQREIEERLAHLTRDGVDPGALEERVQELEARNDRLSRHAAYLETRIESLLARVRYVLE
jgi:cell division protein FtsB